MKSQYQMLTQENRLQHCCVNLIGQKVGYFQV